MSSAAVNELLQQLPQIVAHKSLVLYRLPYATDTNLLIGDAQEIHSLIEALGNEGFAFTPAETSHGHKPYLIIPDSTLQIEAMDKVQFPSFQTIVSNTSPIISSQAEYLAQANLVIAAIKSGGLEKAILSRIKKHEIGSFNPWETYKELCAAYPAVMVYWVSIPGVGTWIGATPETLIKLVDGQAETIALAGTQKDLGNNLENVAWGEKEQQEQAIVSDNIQSLINEYYPAESIDVDGPKTTSTGALLHLATTFRWPAKQDVSALEAFIKSLHPTPAIVGQPREAALNLIAETEPQDRAYYTGLLGPVSRNGYTHLFVNLRCMQVFNDYLALYVGGGLTAASNPDAEWQETELKAQTLLSVL